MTHTLGIIGKAGLGTPHMDGNTRLCTATSAVALKETFGSDGQPGAHEDIDVTDCILHVGHNIAETDTVLWMRVLDRRAASNPPKLIVIDPRRTPTAREVDLHLVPKVNTNTAVLNGLQHPPPAATTMLITLGLKPDLQTGLVIVVGVVLIATLGEGARLLHPDHRRAP